MSKSKTAAAADKAVAKSQRKDAVERTPDDILKGIRGNLAAHLAVTSDDQRFLLAAYDIAIKKAVELGIECEKLNQQVVDLNIQVTKLTKSNEEFRLVYELENRAMSVKVAPDAADAAFKELTKVNWELHPNEVAAVESTIQATKE